MHYNKQPSGQPDFETGDLSVHIMILLEVVSEFMVFWTAVIFH